MTTPHDTLLDLAHLTAGYGRSTVLRDVDLHVGTGETVALLGPNGAGKTTLLRAALGLIRPTAGTVTFDGRDITSQHPEARARAGLCLVPEGRGVFSALTVRENLLLQCPRGAKRDSLDRVLDVFPALRPRLSSTAGQLSGGQQQMLALGRCFAASPKLVALDEVSMGLAPRIVDEIFESLARIAETGAAVLLVEQYVNRALAIADRVYLLDRGRVGWTGHPEELDHATVMSRYLGVEPDDAGTEVAVDHPGAGVLGLAQ